jgi:conjugative relaxase-like TrwC/TraI family protein
VEYFREHMQVGDYLTEKNQVEMTWYGEGAKRLGLAGVCRMHDFEKLCHGVHPNSGESLMVRNKGVHRRVCFFGQISPPKDVSLLYLVGQDRRIEGWWQDAVRETLAEMDGLTSTRIRKGGVSEDRVTGNMIAAVVNHDSSRALDPQLHTHLCIMNVTFDPVEKRWKGVQPSAFFQNQGYLREVCYNKLAESMMAVGYQLESARSIGFNVVGVPQELRNRFSKRRKEILKRSTILGVKSQDALLSIAGESRAEKKHVDPEDLRAGWITEAGNELRDLHAVIDSTQAGLGHMNRMSAMDVTLSAEAHVFERSSVVQENVLLRECLIAGRGKVDLKDLKRIVSDRIESGDLVRHGSQVGSKAGLLAEEEFVGWARSSAPSGGTWGEIPSMDGLGQDQIAAVTGVLDARARVLILQGDAGTGKTTSLKAIVAGIEQGGGRVFGCAPSSGAADVLRQELTADADTLQQLLINESLQRKARDRVILVDEAGLISVNEMRDLCRLAQRNGNRLLLVGDTKQHTAVEAGDALRCFKQFSEVPIFQLKEIRRQRDPGYREAVRHLARGDSVAAFRQFEQMGAVKEIPDHRLLFQAAAEDYVRTARNDKSCLAISPVWAEIHDFTDAVRRHLWLAGLLSGPEKQMETVYPMKWTREECRRLENYQVGDVLTFHRASDIFEKHERVTVEGRRERELVVRSASGEAYAFDPRKNFGFEVGLLKPIPVAVGDRLLLRANLKESELRNGDLVSVAELGEDGSIRLLDGREIPAWFRQYSHGYATTSHSAQGKTVDRGILIMADEGIAAGNLKQAYVSNSRFRESQVIYTSDRELAKNAMMRPGDRKLVHEILPETMVKPRLAAVDHPPSVSVNVTR